MTNETINSMVEHMAADPTAAMVAYRYDLRAHAGELEAALLERIGDQTRPPTEADLNLLCNLALVYVAGQESDKALVLLERLELATLDLGCTWRWHVFHSKAFAFMGLKVFDAAAESLDRARELARQFLCAGDPWFAVFDATASGIEQGLEPPMEDLQ